MTRLNARRLILVADFKKFPFPSTSTLKLKMLMMKFKNILLSKIQEHELDSAISSLIQKSYDIKLEDIWPDSVVYLFFSIRYFQANQRAL